MKPSVLQQRTNSSVRSYSHLGHTLQLFTPRSHPAVTDQHLHATSAVGTTAVSEHLQNSTELGIMRCNLYSVVQKVIFGTLSR
jgi:hypothetical protein